MKELSLPFDVYDALGYLTPGVLFLVGLALIIGLEPSLWTTATLNHLKDFWALYGLVFLMASYLLGHVFSGLGKFLLEGTFIKLIGGHPSDYIIGLVDEERKNYFTRLFRVATRGSNEKFKKKFRAEYLMCFGIEVPGPASTRDDKEDCFWNCRSYVTENFKATWDMSLRFLSLSGFFRTSSFIFLILFVAALFGGANLNPPALNILGAAMPTRIFFCAILLFLVIACFARFVKFLRMFEYGIIRGFVSNYRDGPA
jgi:hypothetical protein